MPSLPKNTKTVFGIGIPCLVIAVLLVLFRDIESPKQISLDRLENLKREVIAFIETNKRAPANLSELDLSPEQLQDHIGEPFKYTISDDTITLLSYGSDKEPGGSFFKRDFSVTIDLAQ